MWCVWTAFCSWTLWNSEIQKPIETCCPRHFHVFEVIWYLCGHFMSLFLSLCVSLGWFCCTLSVCLYGNCVPDTWPPEPLGLCLVYPFRNPYMVGECSQTIKGKFTVLIFLISTLGCDILQRRALGFFSDHTSLAPQFSQCSLCKRRCDGVPPDHKFVSRRTKVPSAIWGMADLHKAWCLKASGHSHTGWRGSLHCLCIQRSS